MFVCALTCVFSHACEGSEDSCQELALTFCPVEAEIVSYFCCCALLAILANE